MLFHVTAGHDHITCPGRAKGAGSDAVRYSQTWLECSYAVKALANDLINRPVSRLLLLNLMTLRP